MQVSAAEELYNIGSAAPQTTRPFRAAATALSLSINIAVRARAAKVQRRSTAGLGGEVRAAREKFRSPRAPPLHFPLAHSVLLFFTATRLSLPQFAFAARSLGIFRRRSARSARKISPSPRAPSVFDDDVYSHWNFFILKLKLKKNHSSTQ